MPASLGFLVNPVAGRNRHRMEALRHQLAGARVLREASDLPGIRGATHELLDAGIDILAISGGDGTVQCALTEIMLRGGDCPDIAVIPGGTTNMTANDFHGRLSLSRALEATFEQAELPADQRQRVLRPLLDIRLPDGERQFGFCMSAGAILAGMEHFREKVGSRGLRSELSGGLSVLRGLLGMARGERQWTEGRDVGYRIDGGDWREDQVLLFTTTLERLLLGFRPWWGTQEAPLHVTALRQDPVRFLRNTRGFLTGRQRPGMTPENGYRSDNASSVEVRPGRDLALDGEVFAVPPGEAVEVTPTEPLAFLALGPSTR